MADAQQFRQAMGGSAASLRQRQPRTWANWAIKVVRFNLTSTDGRAVYPGINLTNAAPLRFPRWVATGNQNGYWDAGNVVEFKWWLFLAGLEDADLSRVLGEHGIARVFLQEQAGLRDRLPHMRGNVWDIVVVQADANGEPAYAAPAATWALHPRADGSCKHITNCSLPQRLAWQEVAGRGVVSGLSAAYPDAGLRPQAVNPPTRIEPLQAGTRLEGGAGEPGGAGEAGFHCLVRSFPHRGEFGHMQHRDWGPGDFVMSPLLPERLAAAGDAPLPPPATRARAKGKAKAGAAPAAVAPLAVAAVPAVPVPAAHGGAPAGHVPAAHGGGGGGGWAPAQAAPAAGGGGGGGVPAQAAPAAGDGGGGWAPAPAAGDGNDGGGWRERGAWWHDDQRQRGGQHWDGWDDRRGGDRWTQDEWENWRRG